MSAQPVQARERERFYDHLAQRNMAPLWQVLHALVTQTPRTPVVPAFWRYQDVRDDVLTAGRLITAEEAERRVLILENPALRGQSAITHLLYAGLQLILPGEVARAHRHTQSAFRLVVEGDNGYTTVDGERRTMHRGDLIITPSWTWHDHGNLGTQPVIWLDGLDIPLIRMLGTSFAEPSSVKSQTPLRLEGDTLARYSHNLLPVDYAPTPAEPNRLFVYPYADTKAALDGLATGPFDPHCGFKLRYINPATGGPPMPTMAAFVQSLPGGKATLPYRSTESTVYLCLRGGGRAQINETVFEFEQNDIFVVPSWHTIKLTADRDVELFSYSDRPLQQLLGLWREEKLPS
jgi:gentisate 1,2-dioxygenase